MDMAGKTVLVTGSTDAVGRYVAARPTSAGAKTTSQLYEHHDGPRGRHQAGL